MITEAATKWVGWIHSTVYSTGSYLRVGRVNTLYSGVIHNLGGTEQYSVRFRHATQNGDGDSIHLEDCEDSMR